MLEAEAAKARLDALQGRRAVVAPAPTCEPDAVVEASTPTPTPTWTPVKLEKPEFADEQKKATRESEEEIPGPPASTTSEHGLDGACTQDGML